MKSTGQAREDGCAAQGADCLFPRPLSVLGPKGFALVLLPPPQRVAQWPSPYPQPCWRGGRRGLQISASAWISAHSPHRAPEVSHGRVHLFSQLECGAAIGGGPGIDPPQPFLWPHPLAPSTFGKGGGDAGTAGPVPTDRPFGRMSQQGISDYELLGMEGRSHLPPPGAPNTSLAPPTLRYRLAALSQPVLPFQL